MRGFRLFLGLVLVLLLLVFPMDTVKAEEVVDFDFSKNCVHNSSVSEYKVSSLSKSLGLGLSPKKYTIRISRKDNYYFDFSVYVKMRLTNAKTKKVLFDDYCYLINLSLDTGEYYLELSYNYSKEEENVDCTIYSESVPIHINLINKDKIGTFETVTNNYKTIYMNRYTNVKDAPLAGYLNNDDFRLVEIIDDLNTLDVTPECYSVYVIVEKNDEAGRYEFRDDNSFSGSQGKVTDDSLKIIEAGHLANHTFLGWRCKQDGKLYKVGDVFSLKKYHKLNFEAEYKHTMDLVNSESDLYMHTVTKYYKCKYCEKTEQIKSHIKFSCNHNWKLETQEKQPLSIGNHSFSLKNKQNSMMFCCDKCNQYSIQNIPSLKVGKTYSTRYNDKWCSDATAVYKVLKNVTHITRLN